MSSEGKGRLGTPEVLDAIRKRSSNIQYIEPLRDPRWAKFVEHSPSASVFHSVGWLRALRATYGFEPIAVTTSGQRKELKNVLLFCAVRSWLTGSRFVSLPFSDHCEPLVENGEELRRLVESVEQIKEQQGVKYVEFRPIGMGLESMGGFQRSSEYCHHLLDLRPSLDTVFRGFHKDCVQRKIRRAEREGLTYETGRTRMLVHKFYDLFNLARKRHQLPPPPIRWFYNLVECMGNNASIRIASSGDRPIAGILTLSHGKKVVYKYGGSEAKFHRLGGMQMLFWKTIQEARQAGVEELDMGRSSCDEGGLIIFKDRWAARRAPLTYWRDPGMARSVADDTWAMGYPKRLFAYLPQSALTVVGNILYRHLH
jgi:hypothetical protein